jgi:preprotein translocase subunit YajC
MEWVNKYFIQQPFSLVIPIVIIIGVFFYAARRAHLKHLERIRKIDESYHIQTSSKTSSHRQ